MSTSHDLCLRVLTIFQYDHPHGVFCSTRRSKRGLHGYLER